MGSESVRQATVEKRSEETEVEETVDGSMMSAETDGCGCFSLLYSSSPSWWTHSRYPRMLSKSAQWEPACALGPQIE